MRKMKDSGIQWIGQMTEKERKEVRDKRKEDCFSKASRRAVVRLRDNPVLS